MFAECIKQRTVRKLATVARAEPPANDLSGLKAHNYCKVAKGMIVFDEGEVLRPSLSINHACIVHAVLRTVAIFEASVAVQDILRRRYLCRNASWILMLGGCSWYDYARLGAYPSGLTFAPPKVNRKPRDTVERMLLVHRCKLRYRYLITCLERGWFVVERTLADMK